MSKTIRKQGRTRSPNKRIAKPAAKAAKAPRSASKQDRLIEMLKRPDGATIAEVVEALAWLPHTVRGVIAGALKKKLGLKVESEKVDPRGRTYRIVG